MTGIERLRAIAGAWDEWGLGGTLTEIADQIERELARHDEPDSTDKGARLLYVTDEDREAAAWVREHGGLGAVQARVDTLQDTLDWLRGRAGVSKYEIVDYDELLDSLDRRLMPEGMEWPRYEDKKPVRIGDVVSDVEVRSVVFRDGGILLSDCTSVPGWGTWRSYKERVRRPAVPASDGEPLEVGQTVWDANGDELVIVALEDGGRTVACRYADVGDGIPTHGMWSPSDLTHQRLVLDADGVPIKVGDTVYFTDGREQEFNTVVHAKYDYKDEPYVQFGRLNEAGYPTYTDCSCIDPSQLTHTKPEPPDSAERIADEIDRLREEVALHLGDYLYDRDGNDSIQFSMELVAKRCRALAERERGE